MKCLAKDRSGNARRRKAMVKQSQARRSHGIAKNSSARQSNGLAQMRNGGVMKNYKTGRGVEIHPNLYRSSRQWIKYETYEPGPHDLTVEKILERMSRIYVGDRVKFNSMKECYTASQVGRHSATIPAIGEVVEHCGGYLMLRLRNGLLESCNYYDILSVNGKTWPYSIKRADSLSVEVEV